MSEITNFSTIDYSVFRLPVLDMSTATNTHESPHFATHFMQYRHLEISDAPPVPD